MNKRIHEVVIRPSTRQEKKLMADVEYADQSNKRIHFGAVGYSDYTMHHDPERMKRYLERHKNDPQRIDTAGGLARDILWSKPSLKQAVQYAARKHRVVITLRRH